MSVTALSEERGPQSYVGEPTGQALIEERLESGARVLIVDDEAGVRATFAAALRHGGYVVLEAASGEAAIELLCHQDVDLALVDMEMPGLSGVELADVLRADGRHQAMGILFISGDAALDTKVAALGAGADDYLVKPVHLQELLARVNAQLRSRSGWLERLESQLAVRAQLAHRIMELDPEVPLAVLERDLVHILAPEVTLGGFSITEPPQVPGDDQELFSVSVSDGWVQVRVPLRSGGSLVGVAEARADRASAQQAVSTLSDLAPQIGAVVGGVIERQRSVGEERRWIDDLVSGGMSTVYQPVVALSGGSVIGFEGLTRFNDGTRPDIAFARAAQAGLASELETLAIENLLDGARTLPADTWLSVNISAAALLSGTADAALVGSQRSLVVELTENEHIDDYDVLRDRLAALPGVSLAVDDTGAGYASLRHIYELRPRLIKLDRGWIAGIHTDPVRQALISGLLGFAASFEAVVVAEGVEYETEADSLRSLGVPFGQGYFFGRPAPAPNGSAP